MKRIPPFHLVGKRFYDPNAPPYKAVFLITTDFIWRILLCMKKYLEQLEEAGKIRNLKDRSISCYKNYVSYFLKYQNKNPKELTCQDVRVFLLA